MNIEVTSPNDLDENYYGAIFQEIEEKLKAEVSESPNQSYYNIYVYQIYDSRTTNKIKEVYEEAGWQNLEFQNRDDNDMMEDNVTKIEFTRNWND